MIIIFSNLLFIIKEVDQLIKRYWLNPSYENTTRLISLEYHEFIHKLD